MSVWSHIRRMTGAVAAAGTMLSVGLITPAAANAAPITYTRDFALHFRSDDTQCVLDLYEFGRTGSHCDFHGGFDNGHPPTPSGTAEDFLNVGGGASYGGDVGAVVRFGTANAWVGGTIPSRNSDQFTVTSFNSPRFGTLAYPGQTLKLNVRDHKYWYEPWGYYDFYLSGDLVVKVPDICPPAPPFPLPAPIPGPIGPCSTPPTTPGAPMFGSSGSAGL